MASRELRAFGILIVSGFFAGFCMSSGSAHYFASAANQAAANGAGDGSGGGAVTNGGREASQHGAPERNGAGKTLAAAGRSAGGGAAAEDKAATVADGGDDGAATTTKAAVKATGSETMAFLAGNTIRLHGGGKDGIDRYMSRHGWMGDADAVHGTLVVHRWMMRGDELCEAVSEQAVACDTVTITQNHAAGNEVGTVLGSIVTAAGVAWPVLRGNVPHMPEVMPLIDGVRRLRRDAAPGAMAAKGPAALKSMVGHPLIRETRAGEEIGGVYYAPDGRWVRTQPLVAGAKTGAGGVRATVGQWAERGGALCIDEPGLALARQCFAAEQRGATDFRLVPTASSGSPLAFSVLADGGA